MSSLVILAALLFEISCGKTDRQTHKRLCKPYWRDQLTTVGIGNNEVVL